MPRGQVDKTVFGTIAALVGMKEAEAWSWNIPAFLNFYEKNGFQPVRRHLALYWDLTKPLPKPIVNGEVGVEEATMADIEVLAELASKAYLPSGIGGMKITEELKELARIGKSE